MGVALDNEILIALGRLEGKVDSMLTRQAVHDEELSRHDVRIRDLEQSKSWLLGAAAVLAAFTSLVVNYVGGKFSG